MLLSIWSAAAAEKEPLACEICAGSFGSSVYTKVDQVTKEKVWFCDSCLNNVHDCFACGLPVPAHSKRLSDGRHYCERDGSVALTDTRDLQKAVTDTTYNLELVVGRYMKIPKDNVDLSVMDRVNIETMRVSPGADYSCPNLQGLYQTITNTVGVRKHSIQILTGLDGGNTRAVIAHELAHAWIADNVSEERKFGGDAEEGFCELVAYLLAQQMGDQRSMNRIQDNAYTRGQFDLYLQAKKRYELQTILDWVKYGEQSRIDPTDIDQVRRITKPTKNGPKLWVSYTAAPNNEPAEDTESSEVARASRPAKLELKGILGNGTRRMAMISGKSFMIGEKGKVSLGETKIEIRCLEIGSDFVRVELLETGDQKELQLNVK